MTNTACPDDGLSTFLRVRPRLFGIAYRMLRDSAQAEDVVQDVWMRWQTTDRSLVRNADAFLATAAARLAINVMQSAHARREMRVDQLHSEPVGTSGDPRLAAEREQALACGVRLLLGRLTPNERAAYILREAFDYAYRDVAHLLRLAEANARQVVTRARQHLASGPSTDPSSADQQRWLDAFIGAARGGDLANLEQFILSNIVSTSQKCGRTA